MPSSVGSGSFSSRRSTPDGGLKFDPFLVLDAPHKEHFRSTSIIKLENDKVFCPLCLELRSKDDVGGMEETAYNRYVRDLFEVLEKYSENEKLRKIVLTILEVFLPKRTVSLERDDHYHRILRVIYRLMKSELYSDTEFVLLTKIMSAISIRNLHPIPLKSAWDAWRCMLDNGQTISFGTLIDQNSQNIPRELTEFLMGLAIVVRSYIGLVNHVTSDKISDLVFSNNRHKREPLTSKYYETSQKTCLTFVVEKLFPNCECILLRESELCPLELRVVSELFDTLRECFINATDRSDEKFLSWLIEKDVIKIAHRILHGNQTNEYRAGIYGFLKTIVKYYIEKEYGVDQSLNAFIDGVEDIETAASRVTITPDSPNAKRSCLFYLLLNWVAIKLKSRYYVASRVSRVLIGDSHYLETIKTEIKTSRQMMRVFAFVVASSLRAPRPRSNNEEIKEIMKIFKEDWDQLRENANNAQFRITYCHETSVFQWVHSRKSFAELLNIKSIHYLIDRSIAQGNLVDVLKHLLESPSRKQFCSFIKKEAKSLFEKMLPIGANGFDQYIMSEFSSWLPALLQERVLRLKSNSDPLRKLAFIEKLNSLLAATNVLLSSNREPRFSPYFYNQFIIDFINVVEQAYISVGRSELESEFLVVSHEFMALIIEANNPCLMKLLKYIDFTLLGYMYCLLDSYRFGNRLVEAIAHVLVAYHNLDYPLEHRVEKSLYEMSSSGYEWMMSVNTDLHIISLIVLEKFYPCVEVPNPSHLNLSDTARACLVTGCLHMLCVNPLLMEDELSMNKIVKLLRYDDFKYHPMYHCLLERSPQIREHIDCDDRESPSVPPSPDLSFASAGDFEEEHISVSRILDQLNEDEGYRSASTASLPRNIYLTRVLDEVSSEFPGTQEWVRRAYEQSQSFNAGTAENAENIPPGES